MTCTMERAAVDRSTERATSDMNVSLPCSGLFMQSGQQAEDRSRPIRNRGGNKQKTEISCPAFPIEVSSGRKIRLDASSAPQAAPSSHRCLSIPSIGHHSAQYLELYLETEV